MRGREVIAGFSAGGVDIVDAQNVQHVAPTERRP